MSLDFVLDSNGAAVSSTVSLSVDDHWSLVSLAQREGLNHFLIFKDYYEEQHISWSSLNPILSDLEGLLRASSSDPRLNAVVAALHVLFSEAAERRADVAVLPD